MVAGKGQHQQRGSGAARHVRVSRTDESSLGGSGDGAQRQVFGPRDVDQERPGDEGRVVDRVEGGSKEPRANAVLHPRRGLL